MPRNKKLPINKQQLLDLLHTAGEQLFEEFKDEVANADFDALIAAIRKRLERCRARRLARKAAR